MVGFKLSFEEKVCIVIAIFFLKGGEDRFMMLEIDDVVLIGELCFAVRASRVIGLQNTIRIIMGRSAIQAAVVTSRLEDIWALAIEWMLHGCGGVMDNPEEQNSWRRKL